MQLLMTAQHMIRMEQKLVAALSFTDFQANTTAALSDHIKHDASQTD